MTEDLKYNAIKFDHSNLIEPSQVKIGEIQSEVALMQGLWDHTNECKRQFHGFETNTWEATNPEEMDEITKKLEKQLKAMKVDKRSNAYIGILEELKKWLKFILLVGPLRDPAMRERHWQTIRDKVNV